MKKNLITASEIGKKINVALYVKYDNKFRFRYWLGFRFIYLAKWIFPFNFKIIYENEGYNDESNCNKIDIRERITKLIDNIHHTLKENIYKNSEKYLLKNIDSK